VAHGGQRQREDARVDLGRGGGGGGVEVGGVRGVRSRAAAPDAAGGHGIAAAQRHGGVVGAHAGVRVGIGRRRGSAAQGHLVAHGGAQAVAGGGEGERHEARRHFRRRGRVGGAHAGVAGAEAARAAAPHGAGGHGVAAGQGGGG